jgi:hypothetical protein
MWLWITLMEIMDNINGNIIIDALDYTSMEI